LILQVVAHGQNLIGTVTSGLESLGQIVASEVLARLVLGEKSDNNSTVDLHNSGTTTLAGKLGHTSCGIVVDHHVLLATNTDTGGSGVSLTFGGAENALPLVDVMSLSISISHTLNSDLSWLVDIGEAGGPVPASAIKTKDSSLITFLLVKTFHGVPVVFVKDLVYVFSPRVCFCHL
jgi:hypothetical protein